MALVALVSCDDPEETSSEIGKQYYPIRTGLYQIYDVERTVYQLGVPTTYLYELKTVVIDSFANLEGHYTYVVHRSMRPDDQSPWQYVDTWSIRDDEWETVEGEGNLLLIKLKYPVSTGLTWDGNIYNTVGEDEYEIDSQKESLTFNNVTFDDCLTVNQNDNQDFIVFLDQRKEIFARDVGLVYKDSTWLKYCTLVDCLGQQEVEEGVIYKQTIKSYGVE
jgi:hypothetical protein